jgi:hypothetical protein
MNVSSVEVPDQRVTIVHVGSADVAAIPDSRIGPSLDAAVRSNCLGLGYGDWFGPHLV